MQRIIKQFENINNLDNTWLAQIRKYIEEDKQCENEKLVDAFNILFNELIEIYKKDKDGVRNICLKFLNEEESDWLIMKVANSLKPYFAFEIIRDGQLKSDEKWKDFIDYVFDNVIIRFDPMCAKDFCDENKILTTDFIEASKMLDSMVDYYIRQHFSCSAIVRDIIEETELDKEICEYICKKIEDNYLTIQLNILIDHND